MLDLIFGWSGGWHVSVYAVGEGSDVRTGLVSGGVCIARAQSNAFFWWGGREDGRRKHRLERHDSWMMVVASS